MHFLVFLAVMTSAALHTSWNLLIKKSADKQTAMQLVILGHVPVALVAILLSPTPAPASWGYIVGGAILHTGYQLLLAHTYKLGDFSIAYTVARGGAPLIMLTLFVPLTGQAPTATESLAVISIAAGVLGLTSSARPTSPWSSKATFVALSTSFFIACYSVTDGIGASKAGTAFGFYGWLSLINAFCFMAISVWFRREAKSSLPKFISTMRHPRDCLVLLGGPMSFTAFALVVWAFTQSSIALVAALREVGVLFAMAAGYYFFNERLGRRQIVSAGLILSGAIGIRLL